MLTALAERRGDEPFRLFAYGALMWKGIKGAQVRPAMLPGFTRSYVLLDIRDRGTPDAPGLTLGLVPGGGCEGLLHELPTEPNAERAALEPAWTQEMTPGFYHAVWVNVVLLPEGATRRALTFVADERHPLWAGKIGNVAFVLATAHGQGGTALEYLRRTNEALRDAGLRDDTLLRLEVEAAALAGGN
jgi:cation transport protein ChaC